MSFTIDNKLTTVDLTSLAMDLTRVANPGRPRESRRGK